MANTNDVSGRSLGSALVTNDRQPANQMIVYENRLVVDMQLLLLPFFEEVLPKFNLAPAQIHTNRWKLMIAFYIECQKQNQQEWCSVVSSI
ncbi:hypothetical protein M5689_014117 [Euphorbia peplus]|nr:hypothetical protein M5689_014117 [Euphorbia peplus]